MSTTFWTELNRHKIPVKAMCIWLMHVIGPWIASSAIFVWHCQLVSDAAEEAPSQPYLRLHFFVSSTPSSNINEILASSAHRLDSILHMHMRSLQLGDSELHGTDSGIQSQVPGQLSSFLSLDFRILARSRRKSSLLQSLATYDLSNVGFVNRFVECFEGGDACSSLVAVPCLAEIAEDFTCLNIQS
jgi:hypothetical protein